jgi:hypothetical protein
LSWPVLTAEVTPKPSTSSGMFAIDALVQPLGHLGLGREPGPAGLNVLGDVHCLTTWSKLGVSFYGTLGQPFPAVATPLPAFSHQLRHQPAVHRCDRREDLGRLGVRWGRCPSTTEARHVCSSLTSTPGKGPNERFAVVGSRPAPTLGTRRLPRSPRSVP